jgi:lysozyme family protein
MGTSRSRRQVLLGSVAALAAPGLARAAGLGFDPKQQGSLLNPQLGTSVADPLKSLLPGGTVELAQFVNSLMGLESSAKTLRLPSSPLSLSGTAIPTSLDGLYQFAMPRLVALVDRAEKIDPSFADQAGGLLAKLHSTQHVLPTLLNSLLKQDAPIRPLMFQESGDEPLTLPMPASLEIPEHQIPAIEPPPDQTVFAIKRSLKYPDLADDYAAMFKAATLRPENAEAANWHLTMMRQSRERYEAAGKRTGVPWYFIAATHGLEASFNFRAHFHNGDFPLTRRTRQVPAGRPLVWLPPSSWEDSTVDALKLMGFAGADDWSLPRTLYRLEAYNGFGYRRIGRATPYLWSFSNLYERGKYVADGTFNANARSQQCGAALMLKLLSDAGDIWLG